MSKTRRVNDSSYIKLEELSRKIFFRKVSKAYSNLKNNPKEWEEELKERAEWESINDHIDD